MKILGIDTTSKFLCLGLWDGLRAYEYNLELGRKHSSLLILNIKRVLDALRWQSSDIDYFACGIGPGSFTGVRIGLATVKGLSWALKKPIVGIPTLDILAKGVKQNGVDVIAAIDAKRNLIYCSIYRIKHGLLKRKTPYLLLTEEQFLKRIPPYALILGDAMTLYKEKILSHIKGASILGDDYWYPRGRSLLALAQEKIRRKKLNNAFDIKPIYLYPKECQIKK